MKIGTGGPCFHDALQYGAKLLPCLKQKGCGVEPGNTCHKPVHGPGWKIVRVHPNPSCEMRQGKDCRKACKAKPQKRCRSLPGTDKKGCLIEDCASSLPGCRVGKDCQPWHKHVGYDDQKGSHGSHKRGRVDKLLCDCSPHLAFFLHEACSMKKAVGKALFASTLACVYEHDLLRSREGCYGSPYAVAPGKPVPNRCVHE